VPSERGGLPDAAGNSAVGLGMKQPTAEKRGVYKNCHPWSHKKVRAVVHTLYVASVFSIFVGIYFHARGIELGS
jgi:hypothetical protein